MRLFTTVAALALTSALVAGAANAQSGFDAARISEEIRLLSDDSFEGRGIATPAEQKVIDFVSQRFAEAGFAPGGENGGWTQAVTLNRIASSNISASLTQAGAATPLTQGQEITISSRLPGSKVDLKDVPLVFVGYGVNAPERNWNDFKTDVRGKIIVVLVNDPDFEEPELNTFGGKAMTYYGRWTYKYEEAARQGAAGVLIVHETAPAAYGWPTVVNSWSVPQFDILRENAAAERVPVEAWVQRDVAEKLFAAAGVDFEEQKRLARSADFQPVDLKATMDVSFDVASEQIVTHNIVARLEGSKRPNETVLYGAHWDHIGVDAGEGVNGDRIFNGAVDNASGTVAIVEIARRFGQGPRPERSIVMVAFTGEESGLLGSEYYAANPLYPLETTVAGFNIDAANVYGRKDKLNITGFGHSDLDDRLSAVATTQGRGIVPDAGAAAGIYFRSDHFPLVKRGVPMSYINSAGDFLDAPIEPRLAAQAEYGRIGYHQVADEWSADWDLAGMIEDMEVSYQAGAALANSTDWPQWKPTSEFSTVRAVSQSQRD
ncbi:M28 family metallopeptidase [Brevundimonas terrae]|uniref:M28 family metallopeptidase n=1 Tax=Brevundimonas terrae TaxID=363631 RepID=A0ABP3I3Z0_9CAUL|nr:M28 family metallopeptidase [Brevundimonas terrae]NIJ27935.1 Zn-dependent M28 family amino/carboxypeptidase [Brevundimonas terrae]